MNRSSLIRGLRITVATVCGAVGVILFVLWMLSYDWHSKASLNLPVGWTIFIASEQGIVGLRAHDLQRNSEVILMLPHVFLVAVFGGVAAVFGLGWFPRRISLRTLLIATTLLAITLGLIVDATR